MKTPQNSSEVKSFVNLAPWFQEHVKGLAWNIETLNKLSFTGSDFMWSAAAEQKYQWVKKQMRNPLPLPFGPLLKLLVSKQMLPQRSWLLSDATWWRWEHGGWDRLWLYCTDPQLPNHSLGSSRLYLVIGTFSCIFGCSSFSLENRPPRLEVCFWCFEISCPCTGAL